MKSKTVLVFIILLFALNISTAQTPYYINYNIDSNFPSNTVYSSHIDKKGYIWFASDVGIIRYDSKNFQLYNTENGLSDNEVFQIKEDSSGRIWFLTLNGKPSFYYNGKMHSQNNFPLLKKIASESMMANFYEDPITKAIYFTFSNATIIKLNFNNSVIKYQAKNVTFFGSWIENKDLICLTSKGRLNVSKNKFEKKFDYKANPRVTISNNTVNISSLNSLYLSDNSISHKLSIPTNTEILHVYNENKDNLWICTRNGLFHYKNLILKNVYFKENSITGITKDFQNNFWLTTLKNGIIHIPSFSITKLNDIGAVNCLNKIDDKIWIGGFKNEVYTMDSKLSRITYSTLRSNDKISRIKKIDDKIFILGKSGIQILDKNHHVLKNYTYIAEDIFFDTKNYYLGNIITTKIPKDKIYNITNQDFNAKSILNKRTKVFEIDEEENLWIGTNYGLFSYTEKDSINDWKKKQPLLETTISDLYFDNDNKTLLIATSSKGIILKQNDGSFTSISTKRGLNNNICNSIKKIGSNQYLIGTNEGLNLISLNNKSAKNLNSQLGLKKIKILDIELYNDKILLASEQGLIIVEKNLISKKNRTILCNVENFTSEKRTYNITNPIVTNSNERNVKIKFIGIDYQSDNNLTYYYKLNNENNWSKTNETEIHYNSLFPDDYTFQVFCQNEFGIKSSVKTIKFAISKPFWLKWWFLSIAILFILFSIYYLVQLRIKYQQKKFNIEKEKLNLEKQMLQLEHKALRLQMNPHFIFNTLNTIKGSIIEGSFTEASNYVSNFSIFLRKLLENEDQLTTLENEIEMSKLYIELTQLRYENKFDFIIEVDKTINTQELSFPNLLLQPIIENAIIHGLAPKKEKGLLKIEFKDLEDRLCCIVDDDGVGIQENKYHINEKHKSMAMNIVKERLNIFDKASSIEIINKIENSVSLGTKVKIVIPKKTIW